MKVGLKDILISFILFVLVILMSFNTLKSDRSFIYSQLNLTSIEAKSNVETVLDYIQHKASLENSVFSEREKAVLNNTQKFFDFIKYFTFALFIVVLSLIYLFYKENLFRLLTAYLYVFIYTVILEVLLLYAYSNLNLFFENIFYSLPKKSLLASLFPACFFKSILLRFMLISFSFSFAFFIFWLLNTWFLNKKITTLKK